MKSIPTFLSLQHHLSSIQDVCHKPLTIPHPSQYIKTTHSALSHSPRTQKRKVCKQPSFSKIYHLFLMGLNFIVEKTLLPHEISRQISDHAKGFVAVCHERLCKTIAEAGG